MPTPLSTLQLCLAWTHRSCPCCHDCHELMCANVPLVTCHLWVLPCSQPLLHNDLWVGKRTCDIDVPFEAEHSPVSPVLFTLASCQSLGCWSPSTTKGSLANEGWLSFKIRFWLKMCVLRGFLCTYFATLKTFNLTPTTVLSTANNGEFVCNLHKTALKNWLPSFQFDEWGNWDWAITLTCPRSYRFFPLFALQYSLCRQMCFLSHCACQVVRRQNSYPS